MELREVILQAGPGGKIRRTDEEMVFTVSEKGLIWHDGTVLKPCLDFYLADFTVIPEERIEVGDWINRCTGLKKCEVVAYDKSMDNHCITDHNGCSCFINRGMFNSELTLIHKGSKRHVFEGVVINVGEKGTLRMRFDRDKDELDVGKTYRMELTEETE